jgi:DNA modification methylase
MVISQKTEIKFFRNAVSRWSRFGPYYAMFPFDFAVDVINRYSSPDDWIIDPFAGRATSIYASAALGRHVLVLKYSLLGGFMESETISRPNRRGNNQARGACW